MGNEMGNQNVNGLRVSDKEGNKSSEIANPSPNASFVSNDLDGLKALTGDHGDHSSQSNTQSDELATNEFLGPSVDRSQSVSSREYSVAPEEQQPDDNAVNESSSFVSDNEVEYIHSTPREYEEEQQSAEVATYETNESMKSLIVSNDALDNIQSISSSGKEVSEKENIDDTEISDQSAEVLNASASSSVESFGFLPHDHQKEQEKEKFGGNESLGQMALSNDGEELILSRNHADILVEGAHSIDNESLDTDVSLIQKQMPEEKEEEEDKACAQESKQNVDHEVGNGSIIQKPDECAAGDTNRENSIQEVLVVLSGCSEQTALKNNSEVVEDSIDRDGQQQHEEIDLKHKDIENKASKTEPNEDEYRSIKSLEEEQKTDDIDASSFEIQIKAIDPCEEENEKEDGGLEEAVFELPIQADYNPSLVSEKYRKGTEAERETASREGEIAGYGNEQVQNSEKNFSRFSSLTDPIGMIVIEINNSNVTEAASLARVSEMNIKQEESQKIDEEYGDLVPVTTNSKEFVDQTTPREIEKAASPGSLEDFEQECKKEPVTTDVNEDLNISFVVPNLTQDELTSSCETMISTIPKSSQGSKRFNTELSNASFNMGVDDAEAESIKNPIYTFERKDVETKQETTGDGNVFGFPKAEENVREGISKISMQSTAALLKSNSEESGNKEGTTALESEERKDGLLLKKTVEELWGSPSKQSSVSSTRSGERHKSWSSSLFSNCLCCTTDIN